MIEIFLKPAQIELLKKRNKEYNFNYDFNDVTGVIFRKEIISTEEQSFKTITMEVLVNKDSYKYYFYNFKNYNFI